MKSSVPKIFAPLCGRPVLEWTLDLFESLKFVKEIVICSSEDLLDRVENEIARGRDRVPVRVVRGGAARQDSVIRGFRMLGKHPCVIVHDAVRPLAEPGHIRKTVEAAAETGCAVLGMPSKPTVKITDEHGVVEQTPDRSRVWEAQTPQVISRSLFARGIKILEQEGLCVTDDAGIAECAGASVQMVAGSYENIKITTPEDLELAEIIMKKRLETGQ